MSRKTALALILFAIVPASAFASGSSGMSVPQSRAPQLTKEQQAVGYYNDGLSNRDKADKLEAEAKAATDPEKQKKLLEKSRSQHETSIKRFASATQNDPNLFQAWSSMGYAYRKTGNYEKSLEAYDKALNLNGGYTPAIEYRAEAYLGLGRLDDVKSAYIMLFNADRPRADELAAAIERWLGEKKANPAGVDPEKLQDFEKWATQRKQIASQTSSVTVPKGERW